MPRRRSSRNGIEVRDTDGPRDPFQQLERSHRRLEERLDDLSRAAYDAKDTGRADAYQLDGVRDVLAFFGRAVKRHEDDEEKSLFPRLAHDDAARAAIDRLVREHREHEAMHEALDRVVRVLDGAPEDAAAIDELDRVSHALASAYRTHIEEEERSLFPRARAMLDANALDAIAREMDERRTAGGGGGGGRGGGGGGVRPSR